MDDKQQRFMEQYDEIRDNIWRYCLFMARNRELAKDLLGETIAIAYAGFDGIRESKALLSWMFTVANRQFYKMKKKNEKYVTGNQEFDRLFVSDMNPEKLADIGFLYENLNKLPEVQKEAIILFEIEGFSQEEIAKIQKTNKFTVKSRIIRGMKKLAKMMGSENE